MRVFKSTNTIIDGARPKVIETAYGFLLNTQYYTKDTLSPIPFETLNILGTQYCLSISKQLYLQAYSWNSKNNEFGIIKDNKYPNRYYIKIFNGYVSGTRQEFLVALEENENNGTISILGNTNAGDVQLLECVDQDDNYLYITLRANLAYYLYRYNKSTFAFENVYSATAKYNYIIPKLIHSNETYIYLTWYYNQNIYFQQYNKLTKTTVTTCINRGQISSVTNYYVTLEANDVIDLGNGIYGVYYVNIENQEQPIDLYTIDITKTFTSTYFDTCDIQHVNITWNSEKDKIYYNTSLTSVLLHYKTFIIQSDILKYLNVVVYDENYENIGYTAIQGIYTFRIDSETNLTFTGYSPIDESKQIGGILFDKTKHHAVLAKNTSFQVIKFNAIVEKYVATGVEINQCYSVGFDDLQRMWYEKTDTSVHMVNLEDAQSVQITFEKPFYEYEGKSISTFINFSALNYLNENFTGTFELIMKGSAVFTENNNSIIRFTYTGSGNHQIPITITGPNPITIYPKFIN